MMNLRTALIALAYGLLASVLTTPTIARKGDELSLHPIKRSGITAQMNIRIAEINNLLDSSDENSNNDKDESFFTSSPTINYKSPDFDDYASGWEDDAPLTPLFSNPLQSMLNMARML